MLSQERFSAIFRGTTAVLKKVYACLSDEEYRSAGRVMNELQAIGVRMDRREVDGCLNSLLSAGLAAEGGRGLFVKERIKDAPKKKPSQITTVESKPMKQAEKQKPESIGPVDKLVAVSIKLAEASVLMKKTCDEICDEIDQITEEVEHSLKSGSEEMQKLQQLKTLLKSLN